MLFNHIELELIEGEAWCQWRQFDPSTHPRLIEDNYNSPAAKALSKSLRSPTPTSPAQQPPKPL